MVPVAYWPTIAVVVTAVVALRVLLGRPLLHQLAKPLDPASAITAVVAAAALAFHCLAMFFPRPLEAFPVASSPAQAVRDLQFVSELAFWMPVAALIVALRKVWLPALGVLTVALVAVGWTMFGGSDLTVHLWSIALSVLVGLTVATGLLRRPRTRQTNFSRR